jgi:hypothetical protein
VLDHLYVFFWEIFILITSCFCILLLYINCTKWSVSLWHFHSCTYSMLVIFTPYYPPPSHYYTFLFSLFLIFLNILLWLFMSSILNSTCERKHVIFVFLCLTYYLFSIQIIWQIIWFLAAVEDLCSLDILYINPSKI